MFLPYVVLPWSLACWAIALVVWALRASAGWTKAGEFSRRVFRAPVDLPCRVVCTMHRWRRRMHGPEEYRVADCAMREIVAELKKEGLVVLEAGVTIEGFVCVRAIVPPHREDEYRDVYDRVHRRFADIDLERLCSAAEPLDLLDAGWAKCYGKSEYARPAYTAPCVECAKCDQIKWVFGAAECVRLFEESRMRAALYVTREGRRVMVNGRLCDPCCARTGLIMIAGIALSDHEPDDGGEA